MDRIQTDFFYIVNENHAQKKAAQEEKARQIRNNIADCIGAIGIFAMMFFLYVVGCMI